MKIINSIHKQFGWLLIVLNCLTINYAISQGVEINDADNNLLMRVYDEGATGSITLMSGAEPESPGNKLYNADGELKWNGTSLISPLWSQNGSAIYYNSGKVGVGVSSPSANFHVSGIDGVLFTGTYESGTIPVEGAGTRMMWYPKKSAFRAGTAEGTQWDDANIGLYSLALGCNTIANNATSVAIGWETVASGANSLALGANTTASGWIATSLGYNTTASGDYSLATGFGIEASGNYSVAIALNNQNGTNVTQANTMAIMGGKVGIGTAGPTADLHVSGVNGILFTGTYNSGTIPVEGAGTRLLWYPKKSAFRVGTISGTQWNDAQIGPYSTAMGRNVIASGDYAVAIGESSTSSAHNSIAIGESCETTGLNSVAIGQNCVSSDLNAVAIGNFCTSSALCALATNYYTTASGVYAVSMGYNTTASGMYSMALGNGIAVSGLNSVGIALGNESGTTLTQANTMAIMGGKVGIGILNPLRKFEVVDETNSYVAMVKNTYSAGGGDGFRVELYPSAPGSGDRFVEFLRNDGNNYSGYICGDGSTGVNYTTLSDERLKMNMENYSGGLETLSKVRVRQYEMKAAPGKKQIGFIAQELLKVYPQAVSGNPDGNVEEDPMGIDYGRLTPLLVSAIQEQQMMIEELKTEIEILKENLARSENK